MGVSPCLLGDLVRYDGGHRRDHWVAGVLAQHVTWVPVCPEVEAGLGTPREPMRLEGPARAFRVVGIESRRDYTALLRAFARARVRALVGEDLSGYVLKSRSPSCGPAGVPRFRGPGGITSRPGQGVFAHELMRRFPLLPVTEETALGDRARRERFTLRVFVHRRWRSFAEARFAPRRLQAFHEAHRELVEAFAPATAHKLDRLAARARRDGVRVRAPYGDALHHGLAVGGPGAGSTRRRRLALAYLGFDV